MADVKAVTRIEAILNGEDITPVTREEAILSGADVEPLSREEYFVQKRLGEGGGGLDYVIPEQTVTITDAPVEITNTNLDDIAIEDYIVMNLLFTGQTIYIGLNKYVVEGDVFFHTSPTAIRNVVEIQLLKQDGAWNFILINPSDGNPVPGTYTISAIRGF